MDNNKDYYKILGVNKDATQEDINKAYKKLCMKWHPDRWVNSSEEDKKNAEEKFKEVNEANSILSDKQKRQQTLSVRLQAVMASVLHRRLSCCWQ